MVVWPAGCKPGFWALNPRCLVRVGVGRGAGEMLAAGQQICWSPQPPVSEKHWPLGSEKALSCEAWSHPVEGVCMDITELSCLQYLPYLCPTPESPLPSSGPASMKVFLDGGPGKDNSGIWPGRNSNPSPRIHLNPPPPQLGSSLKTSWTLHPSPLVPWERAPLLHAPPPNLVEQSRDQHPRLA